MSGKKSKKPPRPLAKHLLFGIPANIAAGPLGFRAELDVNPQGEWTCSHCCLRADRTDPTAISDEKNPNPSRIVFRRRESEPQGSPVPGTSTAVDIEPGDHPTSEYSEPLPSQPIFTQMSASSLVRRYHRSDKTGRWTGSSVEGCALISLRRERSLDIYQLRSRTTGIQSLGLLPFALMS